MSLATIKAEGASGIGWGIGSVAVERIYTFITVADISWQMVYETSILAFIGAAVGFLTHVLFKWIQKWIQRKL